MGVSRGVEAAGVPPGAGRRIVEFDACERVASILSVLDENSFGVFSLHAAKSFAIGEGGAIRSRLRWAKALRLALNFGARTWGSTKRLGDQR